MNRHTTYSWIRTALIIAGAIGGAGTFWAFLIAGVIRLVFDLDEEAAMLWVALPIFILFIPFCVFVLPKHLRKAGIL